MTTTIVEAVGTDVESSPGWLQRERHCGCMWRIWVESLRSFQVRDDASAPAFCY